MKIFILLLIIPYFFSSCKFDPTAVNKKGPLPRKDSNQPPQVAASQTFQVKINGGIQTLPAINPAVDPENNYVSYSIGNFPTKGTIDNCMGLSGSAVDQLICSYTPFTDAAGTDSFTYLATDEKGDSTTQIVILDIVANHAPTLNNFNVTVVENGGNQSLGLLNSGFDLDRDNLKYSLVTLPTKGVLSSCLGLTLSLDSSLGCFYNPNSYAKGQDSFIYQVIDPYGLTALATVTINITSIESAPVVSPSSLSVSVKMNQGAQAINITPISVTTTNPNAIVAYRLYTAPTQGTLSDCMDLPGNTTTATTPDLLCNYNPSSNVKGVNVDSFSYLVTDSLGGNTIVPVSVTVYNSVPILTTLSATVVENGGVQNFTLSIDDGGEGDLVSYSITSPFSVTGAFVQALNFGTLSCGLLIGTSIACSFTPNGNVSGNNLENVTIGITDNSGEVGTGSFSISVTRINIPPTLSDQTVDVAENGGTQSFALSPGSGDTALTYSISGVGNTCGVSLVSCTNRTNEAGQNYFECSFTPPANTSGAYCSFGVVATDLNGLTNVAPATISVNIISDNVAPILNSNNIVTLDATGLNPAHTFNFTFPAATDVNAADVLTYTILGGPAATNVAVVGAFPNYSYVWNPGIGFGSKVDYLNYQVDDGRGGVVTGTLYFTITKTDTAPYFTSSLPVQLYVKTAVSGPQLLSTLTSANDGGDGESVMQTLKYSLSVPPKNGILSNCLGIAGASSTSLVCDYALSSSVLFNPANTIVDTFVYKVTDAHGNSASRTAIVNLATSAQYPIIGNVSNLVGYVNSKVVLTTQIREGLTADESAQSVSVCVAFDESTNPPATLTKSNTAGKPGTGIAYYRGTTFLGNATNAAPATCAAGEYIDFGDGTNSAADWSLNIVFYPKKGFVSTGPNTFTLYVKNSIDGLISTTQFTYQIINETYAHNGWNNIFAVGSLTDRTGALVNNENPRTSFGWNSFSNASHTKTITGYNVYRSYTGADYGDFDLMAPLNATPIPATTNSITDTFTTNYTLNAASFDASSASYQTTGLGNANYIGAASINAGRVFWYKVYAVDSDGNEVNTQAVSNVLTISSATFDSALRIILPPTNKALVHRFQANMSMCSKLNMATDSSNAFSCSYIGPGSNGSAAYDLGYDLLMDRVEAGCPYTLATTSVYSYCGATVGVDSIGNGTPNNDYGTNGTLFYNRSDGGCYSKTSAVVGGCSGTINDWELNYGNAVFTTSRNNYAGLPPLSQIKQADANTICAAAAFNVAIADSSSSPVASPFAQRLPSRKEQVVSGLFSSSLTDSAITTKEAGSSLPVSKNCNTSSGSGATFSDSLVASTDDTYPSQNSGGKKVLKTGSSITTNCVSLFGLFDFVGNVAEWASDTVSCAADNTCSSVAGDWAFNDGPATTYNFDGTTGPGNVTGTFAEKPYYSSDSTLNYSMTKFFFPMGLPAVDTVVSSNYVSTTSTNTHNDTIDILAHLIKITGTQRGGLVSGGSYTKGTKAGEFYLQIRPNDSSGISSETGFRCTAQVGY